jgi:hypothetical protein
LTAQQSQADQRHIATLSPVLKPLKTKGIINSVDETDLNWFHGDFMRTNQTTATMGTTATAVAFAYASAVAGHAFAMWSAPVVKHANKRVTRRSHGILI